MLGQVTIGKWGNNLAVRLPGDVVQAISLHDGERVDISTVDGEIVIRRVQPRVALDELFQGQTPEEWRAAYADSFDWGADRGREIVSE